MSDGRPPADVWRAETVPPSRLSAALPMGEGGMLLSRLASGDGPADFPLLSLDAPPLPAEGAWRDRDAVADALAAGNARLGNALHDETVGAIRGDGAFVIAGQQPGLLLGPTFTLFKAATAINAAARLRESTGRPVIPAFWIASEDHDLDEVNRCTVGHDRLVLDHGPLHRAGRRPPVGMVSLEPHRREIEAFIERAIEQAVHPDAVRMLTRDLSLESYAAAFGQLLARLFRDTPLVLIDPAWLRPQTGLVLAEAARRWDQLQAALGAGREALREQGFTAPLDRVNIFTINQHGGREPVRVTAETAAAIEREPQPYSPSAALRPMVQDAILPTLATVGGPTELLYLWQINPLYTAMGVTRSHLLPRISATLVDHRTARRAARAGLADNGDIFDALPRLHREHTHAADDADLRELHELARRLTDRLAALDAEAPEERKAIRKAMDSIQYRIERVTRRVNERRLADRGRGPRLLRQIADVVTPHGQPQERAVGSLEMLGRFGYGLVAELARLDVARFDHYLLHAPRPVAGVGETTGNAAASIERTPCE